MHCYISSNNNRYYAALEQSFGEAGAATAENRIPAVKLGIRQIVERPRRRDKTGGRTFIGAPAGMRKRVTFDLQTYMTGWTEGQAEPCYGALFQAALGGVGVTFDGGTVESATSGDRITLVSPHALGVGQALRFGAEIRFVSNVVDELTVVLNAPLSEVPQPGDPVGRAITYLPASSLPSVSVFDYWEPAEAVQRVLTGAAVDEMRVSLNGDFHQFRFVGEAAELLDSRSFVDGQAGLSSYPAEPESDVTGFSLVPGSMGQAWFGATPEQFHTVVEAELSVRNNTDLSRRDFGANRALCVISGPREVGLDILLVSNTRPETLALYEAASQRSPVGMMLQLGMQEGQLCGLYLPTVVPEVPEFDDEETRLRWRFRNCRAQGFANDEVVVAFA